MSQNAVFIGCFDFVKVTKNTCYGYKKYVLRLQKVRVNLLCRQPKKHHNIRCCSFFCACVKVTKNTRKGYKKYVSFCFTGSAVRSGSPLSDADAAACNCPTFVRVLSCFVTVSLYFCYTADSADFACVPGCVCMHRPCTCALITALQRCCPALFT